LLVYHFMLGPNWTAGCPGCSFLADHLDGALPHLEHHDVSLVAVSRAPLAKIMDYKTRMGWRFPWVSSFGSDFNFDFGVSFTPEQLGQGKITYNFSEIDSAQGHDGPERILEGRGRGGVPHLFVLCARCGRAIGTLMILDRAPLGRNEGTTMDFVRRHDEYEDAPSAPSCCGAEA
jgi:predicted dithiol-disulfide oxidoreductase (DUF899 family)